MRLRSVALVLALVVPLAMSHVQSAMSAPPTVSIGPAPAQCKEPHNQVNAACRRQTAALYTLRGVQVDGFMTVDSAGNVYSDSGRQLYDGTTSLAKFSPTGRVLAKWGGLHFDGDRPDQVAGITVDQRGNVYAVDSDASCVIKLSPRLRLLARWGSYGPAPGQFIQPQGIAVDAQGSIYVADTGNARVQKIAPDGAVLAVWDNTSTIRNPLAITVARGGAIYVLDNGYNGNDRIVKLSRAGHVLATWSLSPVGSSSFAVGLAVDRAGRMYVADQGDSDIDTLSATGALLRRVKPASGLTVLGVALSPHGSLYVSECPRTVTDATTITDGSFCRIVRFGGNRKPRTVWKSGVSPTPPGATVDIGGYGLYLRCLGQGSPTVILDAGQPGDSRDWSYLQPQLARQTRVCAYDRAGLGLSDARPPSVPVIGLVFTHEEHVLLQKANVPGPYVMAGESWGGGFARLYAYTYPAEVAGLVLIDAVNENELDNNELVSATPAFAAARTQLHMYTLKGIQGTLGTLPLAVLSENTRLPACGDCMEPAWSGYQAQLASASSNTVHVVGLRSGHVMSSD